MSEDVFRIFRQTGRRIALIQQQVERERCSYLKDSYTEKNQLYKELANIFHSKKATKAQQGIDVLAPTSSQGARVSPGEKANNADHGSAHKCGKSLKELRSINVNVLKRCECCRRRAFRTIEDNDDDEDVFDEEAFQYENQLQTLDDKSSDNSKSKVGRKISQCSKSSASQKNERSASKKKTKLVQFSRYDDVRMPAANQRVRAGIRALKKQNGRPQGQKKQSKEVRFQGNDSAASPSGEVKTTSETPASTSRPTLKSRASIKLESQNNKDEKLHLEGNAWSSHLQDVQEKKINNNNRITGLSKAYCAFKKLLNKMEEEYQADQVKEEEIRADSRAELPGSRPASNLSRSDARWMPLRRSSDTFSVRLNTWTAGGLEPTSMNSFEENREEEQEEKVESSNTGDGEKDGDSLHEVYILQQS